MSIMLQIAEGASQLANCTFIVSLCRSELSSTVTLLQCRCFTLVIMIKVSNVDACMERRLPWICHTRTKHSV